MDKLVTALGPVFAAGFAAQQLLEILSPIVTKLRLNKKITMGLVSIVFGFVLSFGAGLRVLEPLGVSNAGLWDVIVSALIVSAGTEGINSVMKFLGYAKEIKGSELAAQPFEKPRETSKPVPKLSVR